PLLGDFARREQRPAYGFFFSSIALRFANGECVAGGGLDDTADAPPLAAFSSSFWCSLSWQYTHSSSQLLPSGGLLSWLPSRWCTVSSRTFLCVNSRPHRPQIHG